MYQYIKIIELLNPNGSSIDADYLLLQVSHLVLVTI